ncbi:WGR domain-containing protein [Nocardiopsis sp. CC223A]|uniref:WGR domain-containing protein n=1 Tax=Nocardiopsis sp. CC223A TaxID=3044051 RepID=UPI00278C1472|nr:WGR domain-containing protein [Nocardiopsis sp. CC223A]
MTEHPAVGRHFGLTVPPAVVDAVDPRLLDRWIGGADHLVGAESGRPRAALTAVEVCPGFNPLGRAGWVAQGLEEGDLSDAEVAETLDRIPGSTAATVLRAVLDRRSGLDRSPHADALLPLLSDAGNEWTARIWALEAVMPVVGDGHALAGAAAALLEKDPYSRPCLAAVARAHELTGEEPVLTAEELGRRRALAETTAGYLMRLREDPAAAGEVLAEVGDPGPAEVLARRILLRADVDGPAEEALRWALRVVLDSDRDDRAALAAAGLEHLPAEGRAHTVAGLEVDAPDDPLVAVLHHLLEHTPEPATSDVVGEMYNDDLKEAAFKALAPVAHEPEVFDGLMRLAELPGPGSSVEKLWEELFNPFDEAGYILHRLTGEQAARAARAMVATQLGHPDIGARSTAGHQLFRFDHPGAEEFLIGALDEYGRRYAESDQASSPVLDHGRTLHDQLEDVVANLYSALRNMKTPTSRTALIERLFTERRSIWRMGDAIGEVFSAEVHREVMRRLRESRDHRAAAHYADALAGHVKQRRPKVKLLEEIATWPVPEDVIERRVFKYALGVGISAALEEKAFDLVRAAHPLLAAIAEDAAEPDALARGRAWEDPLAAEDTRALLESVLTGAADTARQALIEQGRAARAAGRPLKRVTDDHLATLAGTTVRLRLLHDGTTGEVWFLDTEGAVFAFDGYGVAEPPFEATLVGCSGVPDFLADVTAQSERALLWTRSARRFVELVRYGDRLVRRWGDNNGMFETLGLAFPGPEAAADAFERMRATCVAAKYTESDPWYLPGRAAVQRTFKPQDGGEWERLMGFDPVAHAVTPEAVAEAERRELELHRQGVWPATIEWVSWEKYRVLDEMPVADWMRARIRNDGQDAAWHVEALAEITGYLRSHGYTEHGPGLESLRAEVGPPAAPEDVAALEAAHGAPLPQVLKDFWGRIGYAEWTLGGTGMRILGPREVLDAIPVMEEFGRERLAAVPSHARERWEPVFGALRGLSVHLGDGTPDVVFTAEPMADGRVFSRVQGRPADQWWEKALGWMFATSFLSAFVRAIEEAVPETAMLYHGRRRGPGLAGRRFEAEGGQGTKFWEVWTDPGLDVVATRHGRAGTAGTVSTRRYADPGKAARKAAGLIAAKEKGGYRESAG